MFLIMRISQAVKATDFDSVTRGFDSHILSHLIPNIKKERCNYGCRKEHQGKARGLESHSG